jgi:hypothetical protein
MFKEILTLDIGHKEILHGLACLKKNLTLDIGQKEIMHGLACLKKIVNSRMMFNMFKEIFMLACIL